MADDYQNTLKGKIKILYQLEKWQDVIKLCDQYNEKYGKDVDIHMMRFKSERRLSKNAPAEENRVQASTSENQARKNFVSSRIPDNGDKEEPPLLLTADHEVAHHPAMLVKNDIPDAYQPKLVEQDPDDEPFSGVNELVITDPFAEDEPISSHAVNEPFPPANEPVSTDPFAEKKPFFYDVPDEPVQQANEPVSTDPFAADKPLFSHGADEPVPQVNGSIITDFFDEGKPVFGLADTEPPVILAGGSKTENFPDQTESRAEEIAIVEENPIEFASTKTNFDYNSNPPLAFNAEPILLPAPEAEASGIQNSAKEKKMPDESLPGDSVAVDPPMHAFAEASVSKVKVMAPEPKVEPAAFKINERENAFAAEHFMETADEKPRPMSEAYNDLSKKTKSPRKFSFNIKYLLLIILPLAAAVVLWLALSGKLDFAGGNVEKNVTVPVVENQEPVVQKPAKRVPPVVLIPKIDETDKLINEKINLANALLKNNDVLKALAVVLDAKKIKMTEPLRLLEELITKKIQEAEVLDVEQNQNDQNAVKSEDRDFAKAEAENTLAAWQNFLLLYPQSELKIRVRKKIVVLEKKAAEKIEQELQLKIQRLQRLNMRSDYISLSQVELNSTLQQLGKPMVQLEPFEHDGAKVIIDFASGLMWTLWNKPMAFEKAKWWSNRIYAGYSGWRLPTVDESLSLLQMDAALYAGLEDFAVWTGDGVSEQSRSIWVLRLPQGKFVPEDYGQVHYVWAVRKAGR